MRLLFLFLIWGLPSICMAQSRAIMTALEAEDWQAVGRINVAGLGFCTGTLIAPDQVITAAHCMYHPMTEAPLLPRDITFLAGWRAGKAIIRSRVTEIRTLEAYSFGGPKFRGHIENDIAVLKLEIPVTQIAAFPVVDLPHPDTEVSIISYSVERPEAPSRQTSCHSLETDGHVLVLDCDAISGVSGSPVFVLEDGIYRVASLISAIRHENGRKVSLGMRLGAGRIDSLTTP